MILEIDTREPIGPVEAGILAALLAGAGWVHEPYPDEAPTTDTGARHVPITPVNLAGKAVDTPETGTGAAQAHAGGRGG